MAFSPDWCYQPGLKSPGLYISNGSCSVHLLLFDLHVDHRRRHRHLRSRLRRPSPARPYIELVSAAPPSSSTPARPRHPPGPVSARTRAPSVDRFPRARRPRRRAPPSPPPYVVLARSRCSARPRAWPASTPCRPAPSASIHSLLELSLLSAGQY